MKLVCSQSDLNTHLSMVSRVVPSRPVQPVLANVLLIADEDSQQVTLTAFDLSLGIRTSFAAQVDVGGKLTLPAKLLGDIVSKLPAGDLTLEASLDGPAEGGIVATLTAATQGRGRYQVRGMSAEEFPELPTVEGEVAHLPADTLLEGFQGSLFATSGDETKQVLTGVHLTVQADGLEFAATDGHRLAMVQVVSQEEAAPTSELKVTIPGRTLRELERMLGVSQSASVAVYFDPVQVVFAWSDQRLTSRLLEGQYPNYRQLIPRQFSRQMTIERKLLISSLERIAVLADQRNNVVKLTIDAATQEVTLSVDAQDVGSGTESIPAQISGESLDVAFNVKYLLDGLKALNTPEIQMQLNTSTSPVVLTPIGNVKMTYLVMPVQIRS